MSAADHPGDLPAGLPADLPDDPDAAALRLVPECLDLPEAQRVAWLERICLTHPDVAQRVRELLAADRASGDFLEHGLVNAGPDRVSQRLGPWQLDEEVAIGGMSRVYRAHRADGAYDQQVAVKLFDAAHLDRKAAERFAAERRILASLDHPGIARILDGGQTDDGTPYVVMEFVRGLVITHHCEHHKVNLAGRLAIVRKACEALQAAHEIGIVHRDIKAGNILVDENGQPKLIDFGIAKVLQDQSVGDFDLPRTRAGAQILTPEYASPEQWRGELVSPASDVYSLGVLMYELVTGTRPYQVAGLSTGEMERTVCSTIPLDPSTLVARRRSEPPAGLPAAGALRRRLRGDIDRIIMTAMRLEVERRYPTARALADDIERHLNGKPVHARGASRLYRTGKFITRYRTGVAAAAAVFLAMMVALIVVEQQRELARGEAARARAAKEFLVEMIGRADPYENPETRTMAEAVRAAIPGISEQFAGQPALEAEMRHATGFALFGLGDFETAQAQLEQALEIYTRIGARIERAQVLSALAGVSWDKSDYTRADALYQQAAALVENDRTLEGRKTAFEVLIDWAGLAPKLGQGARGVELALRAIDMVDTLPEVDPLNHAVLYNNLAASYDEIEAHRKAIAAYEKSIELHRLHSDAHPDLATALGNLGLTYELVGEMDKAVETVASAVDMQRELLGEDHPQYLLMLYNLGSLQINAGQLESAVENLGAAVAAAGRIYPENHLYTGRFNHRIAQLYVELERPDRARAHASIAIGIYEARDDVPADWLAAMHKIMEAHEL